MFCAVLLLLALACGGGGGGSAGGDGVLQTSFSPDPLVRTIYQHHPGITMTLYAQVHPVPSETVYIALEDPQQVLVPGPLVVTNNGGGNFSADLPIKNDLTVGMHQGDFNLVMGKDAGFVERYTLSDSTIPYEITVEPLVTAILKVDGLVRTPTSANIDDFGRRVYRTSIHAGQVVEVIPDKSTDSWMTSGPDLTFTPQTPSVPSDWKGLVTFITPGDDYAYGEILGQRSSNGETVKVVLDVTP
jgi:hypothetical protein